MNIESLVFGGYGIYVWTAFFITFASCFLLYLKTKIEFRYAKEQYNFIQDQIERFGNNVVAASKSIFATTSIPSHYFWRKPFTESTFIENKNPTKRVN